MTRIDLQARLSAELKIVGLLADRRPELNRKTAVEPRIDPNGPGSQTDGSGERLTPEVKSAPRLYPG